MRLLILSALACFSVLCHEVMAEAKSWLFVSLLTEKKIVTFERDRETGRLTRRLTTDCPAEPACMNVSPDRKTLFVSFRSTGQLASFRIDPESGRFTVRAPKTFSTTLFSVILVVD